MAGEAERRVFEGGEGGESESAEGMEVYEALPLSAEAREGGVSVGG